MLKVSYKPINQEARNNVNIVNFTPQQQRQKTPDQLLLHLGDFMKGEIATMIKTADKKSQTKICPPYKMHFCGILTMWQTSYQQPPLQKKS